METLDPSPFYILVNKLIIGENGSERGGGRDEIEFKTKNLG